MFQTWFFRHIFHALAQRLSRRKRLVIISPSFLDKSYTIKKFSAGCSIMSWELKINRGFSGCHFQTHQARWKRETDLFLRRKFSWNISNLVDVRSRPLFTPGSWTTLHFLQNVWNRYDYGYNLLSFLYCLGNLVILCLFFHSSFTITALLKKNFSSISLVFLSTTAFSMLPEISH